MKNQTPYLKDVRLWANNYLPKYGIPQQGSDFHKKLVLDMDLRQARGIMISKVIKKYLNLRHQPTLEHLECCQILRLENKKRSLLLYNHFALGYLESRKLASGSFGIEFTPFKPL